MERRGQRAGGDYDQDMWGRLQYDISGSTVKITTHVVAELTPYKFGFGYAISGTDRDGPHFHSGIEGFTHPASADPTGVTRCNNCNVGDAATLLDLQRIGHCQCS